MHFIDKWGWPVEYPSGHPIQKWLRILLHTRKIRRGRFKWPKSIEPSKLELVDAAIQDRLDNPPPPEYEIRGKRVPIHSLKELVALRDWARRKLWAYGGHRKDGP